MSGLTHLDETGRPVLVDISGKPDTLRSAAASGRVRMSAAAFAVVASGGGSKGDVARVAEIAGTMAAKRTSDLIPLCHPLAISALRVRVDPDRQLPGFAVTAELSSVGPTGVEMEALTAVSIACLTIYDMVKAIDRRALIEAITLERKDGGKSGPWRREPT